ncbi:interleukin-32 isoform X2 [Monodelphis domestica]|nr:interleukin-32 isoform X2 [Monodelphis domestica]
MSVSSYEEFREYLHLCTDEFCDGIRVLEEEKEDSSDSEDIENLTSKYQDKIQQSLLDNVDANFRRRNPVQATYSISQELGLVNFIRNDEEDSKPADAPRQSGSLLERALAFWDAMLKKIKNWWKKLLTWLEEMLSALKRMATFLWEGIKDGATFLWEGVKDGAIFLWEGAVHAVTTVWEWLQGLF